MEANPVYQIETRAARRRREDKEENRKSQSTRNTRISISKRSSDRQENKKKDAKETIKKEKTYQKSKRSQQGVSQLAGERQRNKASLKPASKTSTTIRAVSSRHLHRRAVQPPYRSPPLTRSRAIALKTKLAMSFEAGKDSGTSDHPANESNRENIHRSSAHQNAASSPQAPIRSNPRRRANINAIPGPEADSGQLGPRPGRRNALTSFENSFIRPTPALDTPQGRRGALTGISNEFRQSSGRPARTLTSSAEALQQSPLHQTPYYPRIDLLGPTNSLDQEASNRPGTAHPPAGQQPTLPPYPLEPSLLNTPFAPDSTANAHVNDGSGPSLTRQNMRAGPPHRGIPPSASPRPLISAGTAPSLPPSSAPLQGPRNDPVNNRATLNPAIPGNTNPTNHPNAPITTGMTPTVPPTAQNQTPIAPTLPLPPTLPTATIPPMQTIPRLPRPGLVPRIPARPAVEDPVAAWMDACFEARCPIESVHRLGRYLHNDELPPDMPSVRLGVPSGDGGANGDGQSGTVSVVGGQEDQGQGREFWGWSNPPPYIWEAVRLNSLSNTLLSLRFSLFHLHVFAALHMSKTKSPPPLHSLPTYLPPSIHSSHLNPPSHQSHSINQTIPFHLPHPHFPNPLNLHFTQPPPLSSPNFNLVHPSPRPTTHRRSRYHTLLVFTVYQVWGVS